uniref:Putative calmodulin-binding transcription activator 3 n=1 Tax=Davidia involucrata TaxID=16924 RepID=A0A5B6Z4F1_DAVIN
MAETRRYALGNQLDIEQILLEAQHRWLRPAEICEILQNYKKFRIAPEPANKPPSGSLFLFDRKVLRYFRKDGHNWRKKKDGKTVKEAHERLKAGSVDVLHCYYAHGEENENFQRRSYWMLEEELSHIVLVHYREVKGNRTNFNRIKETEDTIPNSQETEENVFNSEVDSSVSSKYLPYNYQVASQTTDTSLNSAQASEYEDAESAYNHQASSGFHSFLELQPPEVEKIDDGLSVPYYPLPYSNDYQGKLPAIPGMDFVSLAQGDKDKNSMTAGLTYESRRHLDFQSWEDVLENCTDGIQSVPFLPTLSFNLSDSMSNIPGQGNEILGQVFPDGSGKKQEFGSHPPSLEELQTSEVGSSHITKWSMDQKLHPDSAYDLTTGFHEEDNSVDILNSREACHTRPTEQNKHPMQNDLQIERNLTVEGKADYSALRQPLLGGFLKEGLKKLDSFDRWMSKELGDVNGPHKQSSSGVYWESVGSEDGVGDSSMAPQVHLDTYMLGPSLSQDQLFSIIDFSPNWAYAGSEMKVLITGRFLESQQYVDKCKWSCMFGELEVPAEVIADGVLRCHTPLHQAGRVPFYVTCSNRLACSEVREFEYRADNIRDMDVADINNGSTSEILLRMRFGKLLSLGSLSPPVSVSSSVGENSHLSSKISSLMEDNDEWDHMLKLTSEDEFSPEKLKDQLLQRLLKEKLHVWLLQKTAEGGKGPSVLDEDGQGVLHFAAALGYDWAIPPTIAAGVSVNFRDVNGWNALHWAASYGRERTVGLLISLDAAPGALTDPTPKYPSGRTPADLASSNGHKGIAGYLAESALSSHLSSLQLKDTKEGDAGEISRIKAVQTISERTATPINDGDLAHGLSLKDSLAAVCNATQAAARIHQVFRVQSFQKKQLKEYEDDKFGMSDERALSLVAVKKSRMGQHDEPVHAAATRIQNKFRSWKGRREFLTIRQQIVKIQAHVRGHQVRKNYKKFIWSVGILEKVILRWRRKGSGLRGFKPEAVAECSMQDTSSKEDDYDFLKEGRKQSEERLQKALERVKSMVQYPEARDQYRRLLNVVTEMQETKTVYDTVLNSSEETADFDDDLIDLEALLDDDTFMSTAS